MATFKGDGYQFPDEGNTQAAEVEDKLEIEIEDDTPAEDKGRKPMPNPPEDPTEDELGSYDEKVQARIKKFTRGYHDERRAKEEAVRERQAIENYAAQIIEENKRLQRQLATGNNAYIEQSKFSAEMELSAAKKRYKEAYDAGDADIMAEAQSEIARATLRAERAQQLRAMEVNENIYVPPPTPAVTPQLNPRVKKWVEDNSDWWGIDQEMTAAALGLDKKLQTEYGTDYIGTEEYYKTIDKTMRKRFPEHFNAQSQEDDASQTSESDEEETPRRARSTSVVAPANRSTPPNRIKLKTSEVAIAKRLGVSIEDYAKQVAILKRGK